MSAETAPYFYNPFAINGDVTPVPIVSQPSGSVSYENGYGNNYEKNLLTDPTALPIGRTTFNQILFDITTLLQQYSQYGVPPFITTSQNQGTPFPYPQYARTYYLGEVYENQVASNTALPGTDDTWLKISGDSTGVLPGTVIDYAGATVPAGYLACDGSAVSRSTYGTLFSVITQLQTGTTTNTLNTVSGLSSTAQMYIGMPLESANFPANTTVQTIVDGTSITTDNNATASGSVAIRFFNWGEGDGSTTFNVPDLRREVTIGQGGTSSLTLDGVAGTKVGQSGGQEAHTMRLIELVAHNHTVSVGDSTPGSGPVVAAATNPVTTEATSIEGSTTPFNVMQPSTIVYKIIKT